MKNASTFTTSRLIRVLDMSALPVYEVQFVPSERRLNDRRSAPLNAALPVDLKADRRIIFGRRNDECKMAYLKII